jgi:DtxR family Mn-dependent transcriptional regulator
MMNNHFSASIEDYLKAIYELTQDQERASTNEIAEQMGVTPASATGMIQRLAAANPPLIDYQKHRGVSLTVEGKQTALEIIRHHRFSRLSAGKVVIPGMKCTMRPGRARYSEELEERISQALGNPSTTCTVIRYRPGVPTAGPVERALA